MLMHNTKQEWHNFVYKRNNARERNCSSNRQHVELRLAGGTFK